MKKLPSLQPIVKPSEKFERKEVPTISFNVKGLMDLELKIKSLKLANYQSEFKEEMEKVLSLYSEEELKYSYPLVLFVMEEAEKFILKAKSGDAKRTLVCEVCKKYFNDDEKLVGVIIDLLFKDLAQIKFFKRQAYKLLRFFLKSRVKV